MLVLLCIPGQGKCTGEEKLQVLRSPAIFVFSTACTGIQNICFNGCGSRMLVTWLFPAELVLRSSPGTRCRSAQLGQPRRPTTSCPNDTLIPSPALFKVDWLGKFAVLDLQLKEQARETHPTSACWWVSSCSCGSNVWMGSQH